MRLKIFITLFCGILNSGILSAQQSTGRFINEISVGPSFPTGKFGDKTYSANPTENKPSGLAISGIAANISIKYSLIKSGGIILLVGGSANKQDPTSYEDYIRQAIGNNNRIDVNTESWKILKIMTGWYFSFFISSPKLSLQPEITIGMCKTSIPGYNWSIYDQNNSLQSGGNQDKKPLPWSFCYRPAVVLRYDLTQKLYLFSDLTYFNSTANFKYSYNPNFPSPGPLISGTNKYNLGSVNILAGVGIKW